MARAVSRQGRACRHLGALVLTLAAGCLEAPPDAPTRQPPPPVPDAGGDGAACDQAFGSAPDYFLCLAEENACHFFVRLLDGDDFTCNTACAEFGVACLDGFSDTDEGIPCEIDEQVGCNSDHEDQICVCVLP